jgi:hypothetical protein
MCRATTESSLISSREVFTKTTGQERQSCKAMRTILFSLSSLMVLFATTVLELLWLIDNRASKTMVAYTRFRDHSEKSLKLSSRIRSKRPSSTATTLSSALPREARQLSLGLEKVQAKMRLHTPRNLEQCLLLVQPSTQASKRVKKLTSFGPLSAARPSTAPLSLWASAQDLNLACSNALTARATST